MKGVLFILPVMAVMAWAASYQYDCRLATQKKAAVKQNEDIIVSASKDMKTMRQINAGTTEMTRCLEDLTGALKYRVQVSDLLVEFVQDMPGEIFIYEVKMDRDSVMEKVKNKEKNTVEQRLVVSRELKLTLCGYDSEKSDQAVQDYVDRLKRSEVLSGIFVDIKPTAQQRGVVDGQSATYYEIVCTLHQQR